MTSSGFITLSKGYQCSDHFQVIFLSPWHHWWCIRRLHPLPRPAPHFLRTCRWCRTWQWAGCICGNVNTCFVLSPGGGLRQSQSGPHPPLFWMPRGKGNRGCNIIGFAAITMRLWMCHRAPNLVTVWWRFGWVPQMRLPANYRS